MIRILVVDQNQCQTGGHLETVDVEDPVQVFDDLVYHCLHRKDHHQEP